MITGREQLAVPILVVTLLLLLLIGLVLLLLVVHNTRRIRHRAEVSELQQQHRLAVLNAEREATRHTLREVGRELHDNVGQLLAVAQLGLNTVVEEGPGNDRLVGARDALEQGLDEVRRVGRDLDRHLWEKRSLADAISAEAERVERVARVEAHLEQVGTLPVLPTDTTTVLFRVFQEVLSNAIKHSGADRIQIRLTATPGLTMEITDNGRGFDPARTLHRHGLDNIRERCALIGYTATCNTSPGHGCTWRIAPL